MDIGRRAHVLKRLGIRASDRIMSQEARTRRSLQDPDCRPDLGWEDCATLLGPQIISVVTCEEQMNPFGMKDFTQTGQQSAHHTRC